jgi:hypothetical protein
MPRSTRFCAKTAAPHSLESPNAACARGDPAALAESTLVVVLPISVEQVRCASHPAISDVTGLRGPDGEKSIIASLPTACAATSSSASEPIRTAELTA